MKIWVKLFRAIIFFFFISCSEHIAASPQMPDYIIYEKDTIATYNLLLEKYLQSNEIKATERLFGLSFRDGGGFNCWRGYQAVYKVENDSLFLVEIIDCGTLRTKRINDDASQTKIQSIFGDKVKNRRVLIDWYSGEISFPLKSDLLRWDGVFYRIFEKEKIVSVFEGKVKSVYAVSNYDDNPKALNRKYNDNVSDILFKRLKKANWKNRDLDCSDKYIVTIDEKGEISKAEIEGYSSADKTDDAEMDQCIQLVYNALRGLKFDVVKDKGKPVSERIRIELWITEKGKIENWTN